MFLPSREMLSRSIPAAIVGIGTARIVKKFIAEHVPVETFVDKVTVTAASWAIGGIVGSAAKKYTQDAVDGVIRQIVTVVSTAKETTRLARVSRAESTFEQEDLNPNDFEKNDDGHWIRRKKTNQEKMAEKLERINAGESTFEQEDLIRTAFFQSPNSGEWEPIVPIEND